MVQIAITSLNFNHGDSKFFEEQSFKINADFQTFRSDLQISKYFILNKKDI